MTDRDRSAWRGLIAADARAGLAARPEFVGLRDDARFLWLAGEQSDHEGLAVLLPESIRVGQHLLPGSPRRLRGFRLAGERLICRDHATGTAPLVAAAADQLVQSGSRLLAIEDVPLESPLWTALRQLRQRGCQFCTPLPPQPHHRLVFPETLEEYWSRFSSKTRSQMRRRNRKLNAVLRRFTRPEEVDAFLDEGHELSLKTWQWHQTQLCLANDDNSRRWHRQLAEMGLWRAYMLYSGDQPVAYGDGWQVAGSYHYHQPGYDQEWAKFGPGRVLITSMIEDLAEHDPPAVLDFGPGFMPYKAEFGTEATQTATVWIMPPGLASWKIAQSLRWKQRTHKAVKGLLTRTGLFSRVRNLLRRRPRSN